jgi:uncharacterized membrane protein YdjX (TVP38/TMEM64 family)
MDRRARLAAGSALAVAVALGGWLVAPEYVLAKLAWLAADPLRFALALLVLSVVRPLFAWPTTLIAVAAGYGFGLAGVPLALALIVLTSVPSYAVARKARGRGRVATAGERLAATAGDVRAVTASRLVPAPSDVVSVAAGVADVRPGAFLLGTAIGEIPWAVAGVLAGSSLETLAAGSLSAVFDPRLVVAAALVAVLVLAGPAYRHLRGAGRENGK